MVLFTMLDWEECPSVGCMLIMKCCMRPRLVPIALCAMGMFVLCLAGCRKEEKKPEVPASSPQSYMNDKAFMGELKAQKDERRQTMARYMKARKAYEAALKGDAKCEQPETQELKKKMEAIEDEYQAQRRKTLATVRERIAPERSGREAASPLNSEISK